MMRNDSILKVLFGKETAKETELKTSNVQRKKMIIVVKKSAEDLKPYFNGVLTTVKILLSETNSDSVLQSQVELHLKRNKIILPVSLVEFFKVYSSVFKTGVNPGTAALTVSLRPQFR